ncbi:DUF4371 domain-containing protein [Trichonephila clavata]|uniref:DUF4371 domain-containing protein n=1 Tax=Trichonephila clavata TaxID=2740835 RepID=A0A8X6J968_TRICU|nr:DUF4371 domain-containing protein [Trichonephila clavata]
MLVLEQLNMFQRKQLEMSSATIVDFYAGLREVTEITESHQNKLLGGPEIKLCVFCSFDHLSEIFNRSGAGTSSSSSEILHLHRTKCSTLIRKVISPVLLKEQVAEINKSQFSLILDESTDVACCKHLCLCVCYYNRKENKIVSQFLGLVEVVESTADSLYKHVRLFQ